MDKSVVKLTSLAHGGGCGCKIAPGVLREIMAGLPQPPADPALLVGNETQDDAAIYRINDSQAIVATTDFFMPIVDDPFDFGRIAAANALSDVYAVGAKPILALAVVGMPVDKLPPKTIGEILAGGAAVCAEAGVAVAGGHTIDSPEPIYGLAAIGVVDPAAIKRNSGAQAGDTLILGKPLGIGILSAAMKKGELDAAGYAEMIDTTTRLNTVGAALAEQADVHAMTDVTGFGLLGHLLELCRGSRRGAAIRFADLPLLATARRLAEQGHNTGAAGRNWDSYGAEVTLPDDLAAWRKNMLCDPQTSGGLLVACAPAAAPRLLDLFHAAGHAGAAVIGAMDDRGAGVRVS